MRGAISAVLAFAALAVPATAHADDPLKLYPDNYRVLLENDRVRVLDFRLARRVPASP